MEVNGQDPEGNRVNNNRSNIQAERKQINKQLDNSFSKQISNLTYRAGIRSLLHLHFIRVGH